MDFLSQYYRRQAGRDREDIGPIYSTPPSVQRGHSLGRVLSGLFRTLRPIRWSGAKYMGKETPKALGREALRTGGMILRILPKILKWKPKTLFQDTCLTRHRKQIAWKWRSQAKGRQRARNIKRDIFNNLHQSRYDHVSEGPSFCE